MTQLRKMMLEELQRRNYAQNTVKGYLRIVQDFAQHFHQPPDKLGPDTSAPVPGASVSGQEAQCGHSTAVCGRSPLLLQQDLEAAIFVG